MAKISQNGREVSTLYIYKEGYHSFYGSTKVDKTIKLSRIISPSDADVVLKEIILDTPNGVARETVETMYGIGDRIIYVPNNSTNSFSFKLPTTNRNGTKDSFAEFIIKIDLSKQGTQSSKNPGSISLVNGKIESHGSDLYLFNSQRSVNPKNSSAELKGDTFYTFTTDSGVYGKIFVSSIVTQMTSASSADNFLKISVGYIMSDKNKLELPLVFNGKGYLSDQDIMNVLELRMRK